MSVLPTSKDAPFTSLRQAVFAPAGAYPIRDEKHLVGALLLLDLPDEVAADTDSNAWRSRTGCRLPSRTGVVEEELTRATHFDSLTGLANRELLLERLAHASGGSAQPGRWR